VRLLISIHLRLAGILLAEACASKSRGKFAGISATQQVEIDT
jgi:hypothetical protein